MASLSFSYNNAASTLFKHASFNLCFHQLGRIRGVITRDHMNIPAILSLFRVARDPTLCLPHATVSTFADLPIPLSRAFPRRRTEAGSTYNEKHDFVDIRAVVLDKDNCFAIPHTDEVYPAYSVCSSSMNVLQCSPSFVNTPII